MEFSFPYRVRPANLWVLSMMNIYRSFTGVVNIVFTASMILVAVRFWAQTGPGLHLLTVLGIGLFPVVQPLLILARSRRIAGAMPDNMRMDFNSKEMIVTTGDRNSHVDYWELKSVLRLAGMLIIYTRKRQGYILNREALNGQDRRLYEFLSKQVR